MPSGRLLAGAEAGIALCVYRAFAPACFNGSANLADPAAVRATALAAGLSEGVIVAALGEPGRLAAVEGSESEARRLGAHGVPLVRFDSGAVAYGALGAGEIPAAYRRCLTPEHYARSSACGERLQDGIRTILADAGIKAQVAGFPLVFHVAFGRDAPARNDRDVARADKVAYSRFADAVLRRGVRVLERGAWFVSSQHDATVVDATLDAVRGAVRDI